MDANNCFGSISGAVIGTFLSTLILLGIVWLVYAKLKKRKMQKSGLADLVVVEEGRGDKPMYDNQGFIADTTDPKKFGQNSNNDAKLNWKKQQMSGEEGSKKELWGPFRYLFKSRSALDDSAIEEPQSYNVSLRGHDFTGLGFNICGNMKDGIFVKDVMQRGPASESKLILPGDQITSMTVSFQHVVLEDAMTLLSYASPYEVSLELMRHAEKSLSHKGLYISSSAHPSGTGQSNSLERVCHPFFKSQSIDDLRKVGREHLDQQGSRGKKQMNGKHLSSRTMEVPMLIVGGGGANDPRTSKSPNSISGKVGLEAHHQKKLSVDEVDSPKGTIVQEIKVSTSMSKPEIIPRAKSKVTNVKKDASAKVVEAISPVLIKMSQDFEKMVEEHAVHKQVSIDMKDSTVIDVEPTEVTMAQSSMQVEPMGIERKPPSMVLMTEETEIKGPANVQLEMTSPELELSLMHQHEVTKPQRGQKIKNKENKADKPTEGDDGEKSKSSKSRFGINLPDITLNFGGKGTPSKAEKKDKDKESENITEEYVETVTIIETKEEKSTDEENKEKKKEKAHKSKKQDSPKVKSTGEDSNGNDKEKSSGFGFSLKFPSFEKPLLKRKESSGSSSGEHGETMVDKDPTPTSKIKTKEKKIKKDSRPTSPATVELEFEQSQSSVGGATGDVKEDSSLDVAGEKAPKKMTGFHMPHLGIKLPKFGHSKQTYSFENSGEIGMREGKQSEIPKLAEESSIELTDGTQKVGGIEMNSMRKGAVEISPIIAQVHPNGGSRPSSPSVSYGLYPPSVESEMEQRSTSAMSRSRSPTPAGDRMMKSEEDLTASTKGEKSSESKPGLVSKGLKGLRELKDKVTGKHSHDNQHHHQGSSHSDEEATNEAGKTGAKGKVKLDKKAAREKAATEGKKEKERLKAEKKAKRVEQVGMNKKQGSGSVSSSSDESDTEQKEEGKEKKKSKEKVRNKKEKQAKSTPTPVEIIQLGESETKVPESQSVSVAEHGQAHTKPIVAPRKSKETSNKDNAKKEDQENTKGKEGGNSSSRSSSESSEGENQLDKPKKDKPKKTRRSGKKRKAPTAPSEMVSPSEVQETVLGAAESYPRTPENGRRSASFGDLSSLKTKNKIDNLERAMSMDMTGDGSAGTTTTTIGVIPIATPVEDLSADMDAQVEIPHFKPKNGSLSSISSSETLKSTPTNDNIFSQDTQQHTMVPYVHRSSEERSSITVANEKPSNVGMQLVDGKMNKTFHSKESSSVEERKPIGESGVSHVPSNSSKLTVGIEGMMSQDETQHCATHAVDHGGPVAITMTTTAEVSPPPMSLIDEAAGPRNISVTNIQNTLEPQPDLVEGDSSLATKASETKLAASLLRGDSKTRLMQTVADANTIKVNPISPLRKDSSMSSSSSSVDSSPEVKVDVVKPSSFGTMTEHSEPQIIEISAKELDGIMMSHRDFLQKQASVGVMVGGNNDNGSMREAITPDSLEPLKDDHASFDNWVYVEQKKAANELTCSHSHSDPEPSTSSSNDDEDVPYNRNGGMSPSTYKTEYKYDTSEMHVSSSSRVGESGVYATTMTLPQKTVTQITLGETAVDSHGIAIVSKISLESSDTTNEADLPTLKPTK